MPISRDILARIFLNSGMSHMLFLDSDIENLESVPDLLHSDEAACYSFKSNERPVMHEPFGRAACSHLCDVRTSDNPRKMALRLMVSSTNSLGGEARQRNERSL
jgi:hypothetical protein